MKAIGASSNKQQWAWNCYIHGRPSSADDSGTGDDLDDAKAKFREAWARVGAGLTELDIARARHSPRPAETHSPGMIESDDRFARSVRKMLACLAWRL